MDFVILQTYALLKFHKSSLMILFLNAFESKMTFFKNRNGLNLFQSRHSHLLVIDITSATALATLAQPKCILLDKMNIYFIDMCTMTSLE